MFSPSRFIKSFRYALTGLKEVFIEEQNFQVHILATIIVVGLAIYFKIENWQIALLVIVIALVLILEIINSIMERFIDLLKPRMHQYVKDIKDMGAALVFVGALAALIIGIIIFFPYFINLVY